MRGNGGLNDVGMISILFVEMFKMLKNICWKGGLRGRRLRGGL